MGRIEAKDRLIVALDLPDVDAARRMVEKLEGVAVFFKVGLSLQLAPGVEDFIRSLISQNKKIFLDYKYYDVPETVKKAVSQAARLGVSFLTIHGTADIIKAAVNGKKGSGLKLLTVTVLTSMESSDLAEMGCVNTTVEEMVLFRARKALEAGSDGVITSGREAGKIKEFAGNHLLVVTPGIRPEGYPEDDQKRKVTPTEAVLAGADYLVIGRPITDEVDPRKAAQQILEQMQQAFDSVAQPVAS
ncbi:MAG TPA: orotidine-5'-phosphate decarboxylase [Candidatus Angelobacter sp.]